MSLPELANIDLAKKYRGVTYNRQNNCFQCSIMVRRQRLMIYSSRHADRCAAAYDAAKLRFRKCEPGSERQIDSKLVFGLNMPWREQGEDRDHYIQKVVYPMAYGGDPSRNKHPAMTAKGMDEMIDRLFHKFRDFEELVLSQPIIQKGRKRVSNADLKARLDQFDGIDPKKVKECIKAADRFETRLAELEDLVHNFLKNSP